MHRCNRKALIARKRAAERERRNQEDLDVIRTIQAAVAKWQSERLMSAISGLRLQNSVA
jgi:hypothetical protein